MDNNTTGDNNNNNNNNNISQAGAGYRSQQADGLALGGWDVGAASSSAQLRRVLSVMFPPSYIKLYHQPPRSVCSLFSIKQVAPPPASATTTTTIRRHLPELRQAANSVGAPSGGPRRRPALTGASDRDHDADSQAAQLVRLEPSTEPSSRVQVSNLQDQLAKSLVAHGAKPVGLCPVRRAIYDQCFDELIRQVTVGCIEQGLLLFRVRNELRTTISCYRRLYESAVGYGISKSLDASLRKFHTDPSIKAEQTISVPKQQKLFEHGDVPTTTKTKTTTRASGVEHDLQTRDQVARLEEFYEGELAKKDEIIGQQRAIMRALNLNSGS